MKRLLLATVAGMLLLGAAGAHAGKPTPATVTLYMFGIFSTNTTLYTEPNLDPVVCHYKLAALEQLIQSNTLPPPPNYLSAPSEVIQSPTIIGLPIGATRGACL